MPSATFVAPSGSDGRPLILALSAISPDGLSAVSVSAGVTSVQSISVEAFVPKVTTAIR